MASETKIRQRQKHLPPPKQSAPELGHRRPWSDREAQLTDEQRRGHRLAREQRMQAREQEAAEMVSDTADLKTLRDAARVELGQVDAKLRAKREELADVLAELEAKRKELATLKHEAKHETKSDAKSEPKSEATHEAETKTQKKQEKKS